MNIYTLHQAGSFRPPSHGYNAEIENIPREKLPRPNIVVETDENKLNSSTSQTSETRGSEHSSSAGERTTPRHNVTPTYTNNFANNVTQPAPQPVPQVSASRIDATGMITGPPKMLSSKVPSNHHPMAKKKLRNRAYSSAKLTKQQQHRQIGLIHIQAKDEFMIFEDNTDLVSHITTPSAVRTSPLETDYLVIDHDEFADEQSLFSAITVPKALRTKRNKKNKKSRDDTIGEEDAIKIAPSTSIEESEDEEEELKDPRETSAPNLARRDSIDKHKSSGNSVAGSVKSSRSTKSGRARGTDLRGGKREQKLNNATSPKSNEEAGLSSQEESALPATSSEEKQDENETKETAAEVENQVKSQNNPKEQSAQEKTKEAPTSILKKGKTNVMLPATSNAQREDSNSKDSSSTGNIQSMEGSEEKPKLGNKQAEVRSKGNENVKSHESLSQQLYTTQTRNAKVSTKTNRYKFTVSPPVEALDVTAATVIDSTARTSNDGSNNEGSNHDEMSNEEQPKKKEESPRKIPNSHKRSKNMTKWLLPTSYFCCQDKKRMQAKAVEESMRISTR